MRAPFVTSSAGWTPEGLAPRAAMNLKAPLNRTHSRRCARHGRASAIAKRVECGGSLPLFGFGSREAPCPSWTCAVATNPAGRASWRAGSKPRGERLGGSLALPGLVRVRARGFTLFEIMMALAILLIIVGVGLPAMITAVRKGPMRQAISDLEEGFLKARMLAILTGQPAELVINASTGALAVRAVSEQPAGEGESPAGLMPGGGGEPAPTDASASGDGGSDRPRTEVLPTFSAKLHESIAFRQLTVSLRDVMDEGEAAVRFYPNGTSDALSARLFSETGEERTVDIEITTGRPRIETIR